VSYNDYDPSRLRELRMRLVDTGRNLRNSKDSYEAIKAMCEQQAIDGGFANGKNKEDRERSLTINLGASETYQHALTLLRDAEWEHERAEQLLEAAKDERRAAEWQIRARLADGLFRQQVASDADDPAGDVAFDDAADEVPTRIYENENIAHWF
jgi:hypothetical protein